MGVGDYIVLSIVLLCVATSVIYMLRRKKKGCCLNCCGNCSSCRGRVVAADQSVCTYNNTLN